MVIRIFCTCILKAERGVRRERVTTDRRKRKASYLDLGFL